MGKLEIIEQENMYTQLFGENPAAPGILKAMRLDRRRIGRFRDAFVCQGKVVIYTRLGEYNAVVATKYTTQEFEAFLSYLRSRPYYERDEVDEYDSTYRTFYFNVPPGKADTILAWDSPVSWQPAERWRKRMKEFEYDCATLTMEQLLERYPGMVPVVRRLESLMKGQ